MLFPKYLKEDIDALTNDLNDLKEMISGSGELEELWRATESRENALRLNANLFYEESTQQINRAIETLSQIEKAALQKQETSEDTLSPGRRDASATVNQEYVSQLGSFLLVTLQSLEDAAAEFDQIITASQKPSSAGQASVPISPQASWLTKVKKWIKNNLGPKLKSIMKKAWKIISNLLTPKSWSLSGGIGSSLLGLANVELEITFGS